MRRKLWIAMALSLALLATLLGVLTVAANPPAPENRTTGPILRADSGPVVGKAGKAVDQPNPKDFARLEQRQRLLEAGQTAQASTLAMSGTDRVLVILVEFAGTDVFTWTQGVSTWDPLNRADPNEAVTDASGNVIAGDCSKIITQTKVFTYTGPTHDQIPRPLSAADRSGDSIWTPNFNRNWFNSFMFGNGVTFDYNRVDSSHVHEDFTGKSVTNFYKDMSGGTYTVTGDVYGWYQLPHSTMYYGNDECPGARSGTPGGWPAHGGNIPGAGSSEQMVIDALEALKSDHPGLDWSQYDGNHDGVIDRLWIVHAGYGEEDGTTLLNRTDYGEGADWSHSSSVSPAYSVTAQIKAGPYIMMPENGGIGVFAHESGHNLGAIDLYSYAGGETSPGFWTLMNDDWTGYPIGFQPPAVDPWHLDRWGWLNPVVITDTAQTYQVTLGQASSFPGGTGVSRGAKIELPNGQVPLPVQPIGNYEWWGGKADQMNARMTLKNAVAIPSGQPAALSMDLSYNTEEEWDWFWVQASTNGGTTWQTLTNTHTSCVHDPGWIGGDNGFPEDLCAAGIGGFTGRGASFPNFAAETFDLSRFAGQNLRLRFWYMTDWGTTYAGPYLDNIRITSGANTLFSDDAESPSSDNNWTFAPLFQRTNGMLAFSQNFYLQYRNVGTNGGYDSALGDPRFRFGPANTGLLVWYNNNYYTDNEIPNYMNDYPGFGPKGRAMLVDAHPEPYRDPYWVGQGYNNETAEITSRMEMRDAPFSLWNSVPFTVSAAYAQNTTQFAGRPAVTSYHDSINYYPGAEYVVRSPYQSAAWLTKQWDVSVVGPARHEYGIKAPGYIDGARFRFNCSRYGDGTIGCNYFDGLGYNGSTGNPGDISAQYGWHVLILSQSSTTATLKIWNSMERLDSSFNVDKVRGSASEVLRYSYVITRNNDLAFNAFACVNIDTSKVSYVAGSVTGGAIAMPGRCPTSAVSASTLVPAAPGTTVQSIAWNKELATGEADAFGFQVQGNGLGGRVAESLAVWDLDPSSTWHLTLNAPGVLLGQPISLPFLRK